MKRQPAALHRLPAALQERLTALSPLHYLTDIRAPLIVLLHDRDDALVPLGHLENSVCSRAAAAGIVARNSLF